MFEVERIVLQIGQKTYLFPPKRNICGGEEDIRERGGSCSWIDTDPKNLRANSLKCKKSF
jgi:hypothetical protein